MRGKEGKAEEELTRDQSAKTWEEWSRLRRMHSTWRRTGMDGGNAHSGKVSAMVAAASLQSAWKYQV